MIERQSSDNISARLLTPDVGVNSTLFPVVELHDLYKYYKTPAGEFPALKGVNLVVKRGEFLALVGKSGAGKTTLVNMITSIDQPSSGEIFVDQAPMHAMSEDQKARWRGRKLGVVFQFFQLLPTINLIENITLPMDFCNTYPLRERKDRAFNLLEQVGLGDHAYKIPANISGGQQQRVAIACALANDPPLIIGDEPTGNLNSHTAGEIFDLFSDLAEQGKTLLIVSHDQEVSTRAHRTLEIADGVINV